MRMGAFFRQHVIGFVFALVYTCVFTLVCLHLCVYKHTKMKAKQTAFAAGVIIILAIIVIAAVAAGVEADKAGKNKMTTVYGRSFMNLPHAPLMVEKPAEEAPFLELHPSRVAGSSFSHVEN